MDVKFAEIVFNLPLDNSFTYSIPFELLQTVQVGQRVLVPFGKRNITGIVLQLSETTNLSKVKPIINLLDQEPIINDEMINFCKWISEYYFCPLGEVIFSAIPKSILIETKILYSVNEAYLKNEKVNSTQEKIIKILKNKPLTIKQIENKLRIGNIRSNLIKLQNAKVITSEVLTSKEKVKPRIEKFVMFDLLEDFAGYNELMLENFAKESKIRSRKQIDLIKYLISRNVSQIRQKDLVKELAVNVDTIKKLVNKNLLRIENREVYRNPEDEFSNEQKIIDLNPDQKNVLKEIIASISKNEFKPFLLYGVTGSGKTQIYIESIKEVLKNKRTAIVLVPEIALTPQLIHRFKTNFGNIIGVIHSRISEGERFDVFRRILSNEVRIVIGARSALFAPMKSLGIIVVDEEHDHSYKQTEKDPKYNARDASVVRAKLNNAVVILGSATPSIESFYNAQTGKYKLLELPHRALKTKQPKVEIINMREELRSSSKYVKFDTAESKFLSSALLSQIGFALNNKQSIILLQNRRGYSAYHECLNCGNVKKCPNCDIVLIYHKYKEQLRCHYCGHFETLSSYCDVCKSTRVKLKGTGTEKVEEEIQRIFPKAKIRRMDADTMRKKDSYRKILKSFHDGEFDILVGTQMISKGLDFPNVYLVGVISADVGLFNPDFRSSERTFQLLMQVAGRSGRSTDYGKVIIQTMNPENYIFSLVKDHNYIEFYKHEISSRENFRYPPFSRMTLLEVNDKNASKASSIANKIYLFLMKHKNTESIEIMNPAPAIIFKLKNQYRYHLILKSLKSSFEKKISSKTEQGIGTSVLIKDLKMFLLSSKINLKEQISIESDPQNFN